MQQISLLLRTKLRKPPLGDIISRPALLKRLDDASSLPLVLVVAPAGYGKTTLLSAWLENSTKPYAWLSLSERDNNLNIFVAYLLAAIRNLFPGACKETSVMLSRPDLPPLDMLIGSLINEIDEIEEDFILVLDDYHYIRDMAVHNLLSELLRYMPRCLHLIISTRRDPPLTLVNLRAQRRMAEIRVPDLRLSLTEATDFIRKILRLPMDDEAIAILQEKTEGWITALSLISLSFSHAPDLGQVPAILKEKDSTVIDYLIGEVISKLPSAIREFLQKISILDTFCAPLCDAICQDLDSNSPAVPSLQYLQWIEKENLFIYPLDDEHLWYRFHQLFQNYLYRQFKKTHSLEEISVLHIRASQWLSRYKLFEEAIRQALLGGDTDLAVRQASYYRHDLKSQEQWQTIERLVQLFPPDIVESTPDLLMAETWIMYSRFQMDKIPGILDHIEHLLGQAGTEKAKDGFMRGEIDVLRSLQFYRTGDYQQALVYAEQSLKELPEDWLYARGVARIQIASIYQVSGNLKDAYALLSNRIDRVHFDHNLSAHLHEQIGLCYIQWMAGDLPGLKITAADALAICVENNFELYLGTLHYFLGISHYYQNSLAEAEYHLKAAFEQRHATPTISVAGSGFCLALTYCGQGKYFQAGEITEQTIKYLLKIGNTSLIPVARMFQSELDLLSGNLSAVAKATMRFDPQPMSPMLGFYYPRFTQAKIYMKQNTSDSLQQAADLLADLHQYTGTIHNSRFLMDVLALESLLAERLGDRKSALVSLKQALTLARPSGFIRNFLDMGPKMANLLQHLDSGGDPFVQEILEAFLDETPIKVRTGGKLSASHLTDREIKVLELLAQRLSNKEIAGQLFISSGTIKSHTVRIYQKLNARNRRQAVEKALALGIISLS